LTVGPGGGDETAVFIRGEFGKGWRDRCLSFADDGTLRIEEANEASGKTESKSIATGGKAPGGEFAVEGDNVSDPGTGFVTFYHFRGSDHPEVAPRRPGEVSQSFGLIGDGFPTVIGLEQTKRPPAPRDGDDSLIRDGNHRQATVSLDALIRAENVLPFPTAVDLRPGSRCVAFEDERGPVAIGGEGDLL